MHHSTQDSTYHGVYYSRGALAGSRNSEMCPQCVCGVGFVVVVVIMVCFV